MDRGWGGRLWKRSTVSREEKRNPLRFPDFHEAPDSSCTLVTPLVNDTRMRCGAGRVGEAEGARGARPDAQRPPPSGHRKQRIYTAQPLPRRSYTITNLDYEAPSACYSCYRVLLLVFRSLYSDASPPFNPPQAALSPPP